MLNFYKYRIILDINMDCDSYDYCITGSPICDTLYVQDIFPAANIRIFKKLPVNMLEGYEKFKFAISIKEFYKFVNDWLKHSRPFKTILPNWTIKAWLNSYLQSNINVLEGGKYNCGIDYANDQFTFYEDLALNKLYEYQAWVNNPKTRCPKEGAFDFTDDTQYQPEFSWMVEDFLACRLEGKASRYTGLIQEKMTENLRTFQFYTNKNNILLPNLINTPAKLTYLFDKDMILLDTKEFEELLRSPEALYLFQTPYMFHTFDTNFEHIRACLDWYRLKNGL